MITCFRWTFGRLVDYAFVHVNLALGLLNVKLS
jgi:hypothetical protein